MALVEDLHRFHVGRIIGGACLLVVTERLFRLLGEIPAQTVGLGYPLGLLAGELARMRLARPAGWVRAYSMASILPQEWPRRWMWSSPSSRRTVESSSRKNSTLHSEGSLGWSELPHPSWS